MFSKKNKHIKTFELFLQKKKTYSKVEAVFVNTFSKVEAAWKLIVSVRRWRVLEIRCCLLEAVMAFTAIHLLLFGKSVSFYGKDVLLFCDDLCSCWKQMLLCDQIHVCRHMFLFGS